MRGTPPHRFRLCFAAARPLAGIGERIVVRAELHGLGFALAPVMAKRLDGGVFDLSLAFGVGKQLAAAGTFPILDGTAFRTGSRDRVCMEQFMLVPIRTAEQQQRRGKDGHTDSGEHPSLQKHPYPLAHMISLLVYPLARGQGLSLSSQ